MCAMKSRCQFYAIVVIAVSVSISGRTLGAKLSVREESSPVEGLYLVCLMLILFSLITPAVVISCLYCRFRRQDKQLILEDTRRSTATDWYKPRSGSELRRWFHMGGENSGSPSPEPSVSYDARHQCVVLKHEPYMEMDTVCAAASDDDSTDSVPNRPEPLRMSTFFPDVESPRTSVVSEDTSLPKIVTMSLISRQFSVMSESQFDKALDWSPVSERKVSQPTNTTTHTTLQSTIAVQPTAQSMSATQTLATSVRHVSHYAGQVEAGAAAAADDDENPYATWSEGSSSSDDYANTARYTDGNPKTACDGGNDADPDYDGGSNESPPYASADELRLNNHNTSPTPRRISSSHDEDIEENPYDTLPRRPSTPPVDERSNTSCLHEDTCDIQVFL